MDYPIAGCRVCGSDRRCIAVAPRFPVVYLAEETTRRSDYVSFSRDGHVSIKPARKSDPLATLRYALESSDWSAT